MGRSNREIADLLQEYADLLALRGDNRFKVRAYERAAQALREHPVEVRSLDFRAICEIPHVGRGVAQKIREYLATGTIRALEEVRALGVPAGVRELFAVPGLGPRRAMRLWTELGVGSVEELRRAIAEGRLRAARGFGPAAEERLRRGLAEAAAPRRLRIDRAGAIASELAAAVGSMDGVEAVTVAGSLRRMAETAGDVDLVAAASEPGRVLEGFCSLGLVQEVVARDERWACVLTTRGPRADLVVTRPESWGEALVVCTGSAAHLSRLRALGPLQGASEEEVYERLGLPWIPPTLREGRGEVEAALAGRLPKVVEVADLRGDLQTHSTYSDGYATLKRMVEAAAARGYEYFAVTDHAPGLAFMRTLGPEDVRRQRAEVAELNARLGGRMTVLHGIEVNIGPEGDIGLPDEVLSGFEVVVASVHSGLRDDRERMTRRVVRALSHPRVNVLGHPTGRRIGDRPPSDLDLEAVFAAAARHRVALEISALPDRLDLSDELVAAASRHGCLFAIDTDAHAPAHLDFMRYGVGSAQRAWLTPDRVINTWPLERLRAFLRKSG